MLPSAEMGMDSDGEGEMSNLLVGWCDVVGGKDGIEFILWIRQLLTFVRNAQTC